MMQLVNAPRALRQELRYPAAVKRPILLLVSKRCNKTIRGDRYCTREEQTLKRRKAYPRRETPPITTFHCNKVNEALFVDRRLHA
jgi:hypothetical protein